MHINEKIEANTFFKEKNATILVVFFRESMESYIVIDNYLNYILGKNNISIQFESYPWESLL